MKFEKRLVDGKQHPEAEVLLSENYSQIGYILKNKQKNKCVRIHTANNNKNEIKKKKIT